MHLRKITICCEQLPWEKIATRVLSSSIGEHCRHIMDIYFAMIQGVEQGAVNFNLRRRGAQSELSREIAFEELT